jgi:pyruvate kinase
MAEIAVETENHLRSIGRKGLSAPLPVRTGSVAEPMALTAVDLAEEVGADAIITPTLTGRTAGLIAKYRPWSKIVALGPTQAVLQGMALIWGVHPVLLSPIQPGEDRLEAAVRDSFRAGQVHAGARVVVLAGHPYQNGPGFPTLRIVRVGENGQSVEA